MTIRVFVADDHEVVREGIASLLSTAGDMDLVGMAATGEEAIRLVPGAEADVVLVDIRLPDMNGVELIRALRSAFPSASPIVLTVYDSDDVLFEALDAGARGYFLKDVKAEDLLASIRAVHAGERRISGALLDRVLSSIAGDARSPEGLLDADEIAILRALAAGRTNHEIAAERFVSLPTLKRRLRRIFDKLGVDDRTQAVAAAAKRQLL